MPRFLKLDLQGYPAESYQLISDVDLGVYESIINDLDEAIFPPKQYTREEVCVYALKEGEKELAKFNFLVNIQTLEECLFLLNELSNESFNEAYGERKEAFIEKAKKLIDYRQENEKKEIFPPNQQSLQVKDNHLFLLHTMESLPKEVLQLIFLQLSFSEQCKARGVSKFFKETFDSSKLFPSYISLPYNFLLDTKKLIEIDTDITSSTLEKNIRNSYHKSTGFFRSPYQKKCTFFRSFKHSFDRELCENIVLKKCMDYKTNKLDAIAFKKQLTDIAANKAESNSNILDAYCALIFLELEASDLDKSTSEGILISYIHKICFFGNCNDAKTFQKQINVFMEKAAYVDCLEYSTGKKLIQEITNLAVKENIIEGNHTSHLRL